MFKVLEENLEAQGVYVLTRGRICAEEASDRGLFWPSNDSDDPATGRIAIYRKVADVPEDALIELATLAHEAGHFETFRLSLRPLDYPAAVEKVSSGRVHGLSDRERRVVWEEEVRAWTVAGTVLRDLGFADWDGFRRCVIEGLTWYQETLGVSQETLPEVVPSPG
jgi:hypothetical protein